MINVSELIGDTDFCQPNGISITRSISEYENHKLKYTEKNIKLTGIITIADENEDSLLYEADMIEISDETIYYLDGTTFSDGDLKDKDLVDSSVFDEAKEKYLGIKNFRYTKG